jgi:hypothetical protein
VSLTPGTTLQLLPRALTDANFGPESIQMGDNGLTLARVGVALSVCVCACVCVRVSVRVRACGHEGAQTDKSSQHAGGVLSICAAILATARNHEVRRDSGEARHQLVSAGI